MADQERWKRMPTGTAKERAQAEAVRLFDKGGSITHALPEQEPTGNQAIADKVARRKAERGS